MTNVTTVNNKQINTGTRLGAMLADHFFMSLIAMIFYFPEMVSSLIKFQDPNNQAIPNFENDVFIYISIFGFAIYFCKDCINGRSIAKRLLKLQVVDNTTGQVASPLKCFIRNLFIIIWPIEGIIALVNPSRRLGDRVAGTKLIIFDPTLENRKINIIQILISVVISYGLVLLFTLSFMGLISRMGGQKIKYVETSYNQQSSKELTQLLKDSLGQYFSSNVKIYDKIENENLKYISLKLFLNENYLKDENSYNKLNLLTTNLIYSKFSKETFTGEIKYIFHAPNQKQSRIISFGTLIKPKRLK
jgi:uncharacterized RDD family membrane protein YckC